MTKPRDKRDIPGTYGTSPDGGTSGHPPLGGVPCHPRHHRAAGGGEKFGGPTASVPRPDPFRDFFLSVQEFDLFGDPVPAPVSLQRRSQRGGRPGRRELGKMVIRLTEAGLTRLSIAKLMGISLSSLYRNYFPEIGARAGQPGRRAHCPTEISRETVRLLAAGGASQPEIGAAVGISIRTLRKHYRAQLGSRTKG